MKDVEQILKRLCEHRKAEYIGHTINDDNTVTIEAAIKVRVSMKELEMFENESSKCL